MTGSIRYGANFRIIGKTDPQLLSSKTAFRPIQGTLHDLADHISQGHPWMPALLDYGSRRWQQHANYAEIIAADIDSGMTITEALVHPFIAAHCGLGIETNSSRPEHNKFRLVFKLSLPLTNWQTIRICNRYLIELLSVADPSCKDASRFFFGALGKTPFHLSDTAALPTNFEERALAWHEEQERMAETTYLSAIARRQQYQSESTDLYARIKEALSYIPARSPGSGNYEESIKVLMALCNELGESEAIALGEWWSPSIRGTTWNVPRKVASFRRSTARPVTLGTLFKIAKQYGYCPPKPKQSQGFDWLKRFKQSHVKGPLEPTTNMRMEPTIDIEYATGHRLETWQAAHNQGYRYILDSSPPGTGKSHDAGRAMPKLFEAKQLIYLSASHRNPTTETLASWNDLEARHSGLIREQTVNEETRWRRAKKGENPDLSGNCTREQAIEVLRNKGVQGADTASLICSTCPHREACLNAEGKNFGYLFQRCNVLATSRFRAHPASLSIPAELATDKKGKSEDPDTAIIWDEAGETLEIKRSIAIQLKDLEQTIGALMPHHELFQALQPLLAALINCFSKEVATGKYGLSHPQVIERLPLVDVELEVVRKVLQPDLSFLNTTAEYGTDLADLQPSIRRKFTEKDADIASVAEQRVLKQWLPELLEILQNSPGNLHLTHEQLVISLPDFRHRRIVQAAKAVVFLDATLTREDLALKLGCSPEQIFVCRQTIPDYQNLKIIQVFDLGRLTRQRGADQQRRVDALVLHYQNLNPTTKIIDFKTCSTEGWGVWWRDSRGVNDFEQVKRLILIGTPCRNLAALQAEYAILTGDYALKEQGFQDFIDRNIQADFNQAIGRLRAHRRPDEQLEIIILSNFALKFTSVNYVAAADITLNATSKTERLLIAARKAICELKKAGGTVTQSAIAQICECSQQRISQLWHLLKTLLEPTNEISSTGAEEIQEIIEITENAIPLCQKLNQTIATVSEIFLDWLDPAQHQHFWQKLKAQTQIRILETLLLTLPEAHIQNLCKD